MNKREVKVLLVNSLFEYSEKIIEYERSHFRQFIGKDILKVDREVKVKYSHPKLKLPTGPVYGGKDDLPALEVNGAKISFTYYFSNTTTRMNIHIKASITGGSYDVKPSTHFNDNEDTIVTLFDINNGLLAECTQFNEIFETRYDLGHLEVVASKIRAYRKQYEMAVAEMPSRFKAVFEVGRIN